MTGQGGAFGRPNDRRRALPTLEDLREAILADHPECRRYRGGGHGALHTLAQIVCDWATPAGQALVARSAMAGGAEMLRRWRLSPAARARKGAEAFADKRARDLERLEALAVVWSLEDAAKTRRAA